MAAVLALILIVLSALSFSVVLDQDAVEMLPFTIFAFILYYYLFYCANLLAVGIISLYLLIAGKEPNVFHHRFYFELLGTGINIENYYPDTDMYDGLDPSPYSVEETAEKWYARLQKEGYDYIYVYSTNETYEQAFAHLGLGEVIPGRAYKVSNEHFSK